MTVGGSGPGVFWDNFKYLRVYVVYVMAEHISSCVNCGDEISNDVKGAYCSESCKVENERPPHQLLDSEHFAALRGEDESGRY